MVATRRYPGVHAVLYALFDRDEKLDRVAMKRQIDLCIGAGVDGIAVLGLATEVGKLTESERHGLVEWTAEDVAGRVPLAVTVAGHAALDQIELARAAEKAGADWLILQPSLVAFGGVEETIAMYGRVADATGCRWRCKTRRAISGAAFRRPRSRRSSRRIATARI